MNLYVIRDMLAGESGPVFEQKNDACAERQFLRVFEGRDSSSYRLLRVGVIDHEKDVLVGEGAVEVVVSGVKRGE